MSGRIKPGMCMMTKLQKELYALQDIRYRDFQAGLIPGMEKDSFIGVRTPDLRRVAKRLAKEPASARFMEDLPHRTFDENQIHAFIISGVRDYGPCIDRLNAFLPYVDNWATCDQMSPVIFKEHRKTALVKQYDAIVPFIEGKKLETWTHNKAIQKAIESHRIRPEQKQYLKTLKTVNRTRKRVMIIP